MLWKSEVMIVEPLLVATGSTILFGVTGLGATVPLMPFLRKRNLRFHPMFLTLLIRSD